MRRLLPIVRDRAFSDPMLRLWDFDSGSTVTTQ
jgi:hypothetical protein